MTKDSSQRKRKSLPRESPQPTTVSVLRSAKATMEIESDNEFVTPAISKGKQKARTNGSDQEAGNELDHDSDSLDSDEDGVFPELFLSDRGEEDSQGSNDEGNDTEDSIEFSEEVDDAELGSLLDSSSDSDNSNEDLDAFISRSTTKPNEDDPALETFGQHGVDYMKKAKTKPSKFVDGISIQVWDDIEPGYGSESSTEDVGWVI